MKRRLLAVGLVIAAVPCTALAAGNVTYRGRTSQGYRVTMKVRPDGAPATIAFRFNSRCSNGYRIHGLPGQWINAQPGPFEQSGDTFSDSGQFTLPVRPSYEDRVSASLHGRMLHGGRASGTQTAKVVITKRPSGKRVAVCRSRVSWSARRR